jgi:hypothetical protein
VIEPGLSYKGEFGDVTVLAAVTGLFGHFNGGTGGESDDVRQVYGGLNIGIGPVVVGGGYGWQKGGRPFSSALDGDETYIGDTIVEAGAKQQWYNVGVGLTLDAANISFNWGQVLSSEVGGGSPGSRDPEPYAAVLGFDVGIAPGLVVGGEISYFENADGTPNNDGFLGLAGVRLDF